MPTSHAGPILSNTLDFSLLARISGVHFVWSQRDLVSLGDASVPVWVLWTEDSAGGGYFSQNPIKQRQRSHPWGASYILVIWAERAGRKNETVEPQEISKSKRINVRSVSRRAWQVLNKCQGATESVRAADGHRPCSHNVWVKSLVLKFS